ncbi:hypothetical protein ABIB38_000853 [Massilia sp. UYP11]
MLLPISPAFSPFGINGGADVGAMFENFDERR